MSSYEPGWSQGGGSPTLPRLAQLDYGKAVGKWLSWKLCFQPLHPEAERYPAPRGPDGTLASCPGRGCAGGIPRSIPPCLGSWGKEIAAIDLGTLAKETARQTKVGLPGLEVLGYESGARQKEGPGLGNLSPCSSWERVCHGLACSSRMCMRCMSLCEL